MRHVQFQEVQHFRQAWLWYLLISSSIISMIPLIVIAAAGEMPLWESLLAIGIIIALMLVNIAVFYYARLETMISNEGISYRWWPFFRKPSVLRWEDIDHVVMAQFRAFKVGFSIDKKLGRVHNVNGPHGFQVVLYNGKKYFFGTQRKLSVESVLQQTGKLKL